MDRLIIEREKNTPYINFDNVACKLEMKGTSIPEDSYKFFFPITEWVEQFLEEKPTAVTVDMQFEYMNTSSSKWVLKILQMLSDYQYKKNCISYNWYYDESDMYDTGHYYQSLLEVEFNFIEYR